MPCSLVLVFTLFFSLLVPLFPYLWCLRYFLCSLSRISRATMLQFTQNHTSRIYPTFDWLTTKLNSPLTVPAQDAPLLQPYLYATQIFSAYTCSASTIFPVLHQPSQIITDHHRTTLNNIEPPSLFADLILLILDSCLVKQAQALLIVLARNVLCSISEIRMDFRNGIITLPYLWTKNFWTFGLARRQVTPKRTPSNTLNSLHPTRQSTSRSWHMLFAPNHAHKTSSDFTLAPLSLEHDSPHRIAQACCQIIVMAPQTPLLLLPPLLWLMLLSLLSPPRGHPTCFWTSKPTAAY